MKVALADADPVAFNVERTRFSLNIREDRDTSSKEHSIDDIHYGQWRENDLLTRTNRFAQNQKQARAGHRHAYRRCCIESLTHFTFEFIGSPFHGEKREGVTGASRVNPITTVWRPPAHRRAISL